MNSPPQLTDEDRAEAADEAAKQVAKTLRVIQNVE